MKQMHKTSKNIVKLTLYLFFTNTKYNKVSQKARLITFRVIRHSFFRYPKSDPKSEFYKFFICNLKTFPI